MGRPSSDARSRDKPSRSFSHDKNDKSFARGPRTSISQHLKPASPPKTNPWTTRRSSTAISPDWPSITPDFASISNPRIRDDAGPPKKEEATKQDPDNSCSAGDQGLHATPTPEKAQKQSAPRAGQSLWLRPFGADVFVRVGSRIFEVHRSIIEPQSTFFQQNLPPRECSNVHDPIDMQLESHPEAVANTLRFMYTKTLDLCEYDRQNPRDLIHVPRSVLLYMAAMDLGVEAMKTEILQVLRRTAGDLALYYQAKLLARTMDQQEVMDGTLHLHNALEAAYASEHREDVLPLRLALCQLLDTMIPFLIQYPANIALFSSSVWKTYAAEISVDLLAARNLKTQTAADWEKRHDNEGKESRSEKVTSPCIESADCPFVG
ncbi:hypothetical protein E4U19_001871 [Claviceps sp. Clav32 group G5]|nr:hypothetical protein E4U40_005976 [Claviceps sp. LM458 group G5]KAG6037624.1 hypothetical protein E4U19_001871 [Claviceps sp. Clav32 group G5]